MIDRNVYIRTLLRALVLSSLALSAACDMHSSAPRAANAADVPVQESQLPEVVITAPRLRPDEPPMRRTAKARVPQEPNIEQDGG